MAARCVDFVAFVDAVAHLYGHVRCWRQQLGPALSAELLVQSPVNHGND